MKSFAYTLLLFSVVGLADPAIIVNPGAIIYVKPDFDAEHITEVDSGVKVEVSKRAFGPFHRVRTADGKVGFIADNDYTLSATAPVKSSPKKLSPSAQKTKKLEEASDEDAQEAQKPDKTSDKKPKRQKSFSLTRYRGVSISYMGYREQTMNGLPMSDSIFYGFKMFGPDVVVDGAMVTEVNVDILPSAPSFYQTATNNSTSGFILHTDLLFESVYPQSKDSSTFFAFGPMFKYDRYSVSLGNSTKRSTYDLEDMILGAVFEAGASMRLGAVAIRAEVKYDWEKSQYWGLGTSLLFPF